MMLKKATKQFSIVSLIIVGTIIWSITMFRSGLQYSYGLGFWGANGHDGIWHLALANSLSELKFTNPVFSGEALKNYHLGFDLLLSILHKLTTIPISILYFQVLPPVFALTIGLFVYLFIWNWRGSRAEAMWAVFFVYFSSSFGFVITFLRDRQITGESMFWSQQSVSTLINPPYALSLIFILLGLIFLKKRKLFLSILCFGILIQVKAYAAILVLGGLFVTAIYSYYILRSTYYIRVFFGSLILNLILFFAVKNDGLSAFVWQPFWFLETMMSYSDRLGWERFYSAMTTYKMGHVFFKGVLAYSIAFVIFIFGNMGMRVIGFRFLKKTKLDSFLVFMTSIVMAAVVIPTFFVQNGTPWNTIQFFYYYLFFFSIFAGIATAWSSNFVKLLVVTFAIFGTWATLQHYLPKNPQAMISKNEVEALDYLFSQSDGIVLTYPFDKYKAAAAVSNPPRPLYVYDSTAYVSAISGKQTFLEDEVNLNIMGYVWNSRREEVLSFISNLDPKKGRDFLTKNNIKYLYLVKAVSPLQGELLKLGSAELGLEKIFENKESIIYRYGENIGSN